MTIKTEKTNDPTWPWKAVGVVPNVGKVIKLDSDRERAIERVKARFGEDNV